MQHSLRQTRAHRMSCEVCLVRTVDRLVHRGAEGAVPYDSVGHSYCEGICLSKAPQFQPTTLARVFGLPGRTVTL